MKDCVTVWVWAAILAGALCAGGCRTAEPLERYDISRDGWTLAQGQGLWTGAAGADGLVVEVVFARHTDGRAQLQAFKEVIPLAIVQLGDGRWTVEDPLRKRRAGGVNGSGAAARFGWLQLALTLNGRPLASQWLARREEGGRFFLEDSASGERFELVLEPGS